MSGCKDKPKHKAPPPNATMPTAKPSEPGAPAPDLALPPMTGGPPKKTTAPHTKADYEKLSLLEYPGFERRVKTVGDKAFEVLQLTNGHPKYGATVTILPASLEACMEPYIHTRRFAETRGRGAQPVTFTFRLEQ